MTTWFAIIDTRKRHGVVCSVRGAWLAHAICIALGGAYDYQQWGV